MEAAARDPRYRPAPPSPPQRPAPAGNQPAGKAPVQRTPGAEAEPPPPPRRPGRDLGHIPENNGVPVSPAFPPPCNAMPPMRRPQIPKDTAQTTSRGLAAGRPGEGADGDAGREVDDPQFKPPDDTLSAIAKNADVARLLADMLEMDDVINIRAANDTMYRTKSLTCPAYSVRLGYTGRASPTRPTAVSTIRAVRGGDTVWVLDVRMPRRQKRAKTNTAAVNRWIQAAAQKLTALETILIAGDFDPTTLRLLDKTFPDVHYIRVDTSSPDMELLGNINKGRQERGHMQEIDIVVPRAVIHIYYNAAARQWPAVHYDKEALRRMLYDDQDFQRDEDYHLTVNTVADYDDLATAWGLMHHIESARRRR